jgi:outer membrane protein
MKPLYLRPNRRNMKNLSLALNGVLIVAVGILYYLHFNGKSTAHSDNTVASGPMSVSSKGIVFVNSDSLLESYDFYKDQKTKFEAEQNRIQNELKNESDKLQKDAAIYQQQAIGMTDMERQQKEQQLGMRQQNLMEKKDAMLGRLDEMQSSSSEELYTKLNNYLREFNADKNLQFVLGYQKGGGILFANDSLNVTRQVIEGLNKAYAAEKQ